MYTLYIDETGDWGYPNYDPDRPILCICGTIVRDEYYPKHLAPSLTKLKKTKFGKDVVLHRYKVRARKGEFSVLKTESRADACIAQISQLIANLDFTLLLAALDKVVYYRTYGMRKVDNWLPADIYALLFTFIVERFAAFLMERGKATSKIVAERRGRKEDQKLQFWYSSILQNGTQFYRGWQLQKVLPTAVEFKAKRDNVLGLQISDWIATPMSEKVQYPDGSKDKFGEWGLYKDKIWLGMSAPARGQVGFKTFPKNLGRRLLNMPLKSA